MKQWFSTFFEGIGGLSATTWYLVALLLLSAVVLTFVLKKRNNAYLTAILWVAALGATVALLVFSSPEVYVEEGANTSASYLYNPVFWSVVIAVGGVVLLIMLLRRHAFTTRMLSTGALCVALAFLLSCLTLWRSPQGGSITPASMMPIFIFSYLYGPVPGIAAGTVDGVLQLIQGIYVVHPIQFLLDYILPFAILGCAGFFRREKQFPIGVALGCTLRFAMHVLSGVVFFYMYATPGQNVWVYSILYNGSYMLPETIICLIIACLPSVNHTLSRLRRQSGALAA